MKKQTIQLYLDQFRTEQVHRLMDVSKLFFTFHSSKVFVKVNFIIIVFCAFEREVYQKKIRPIIINLSFIVVRSHCDIFNKKAA